MTSRLNNRIMKMEKRTAPVDLEKWMRTPLAPFSKARDAA